MSTRRYEVKVSNGRFWITYMCAAQDANEARETCEKHANEEEWPREAELTRLAGYSAPDAYVSYACEDTGPTLAVYAGTCDIIASGVEA